MRRARFVRTPPALAAAALAGVVHAAVVPDGQIGVGPGFAQLGPGDTVLPDRGAWVGTGAGNGSLTVDGTSFLQLARLSFGSAGVGAGTGLVTGAGTRVELVGDGASDSQVQRLVVGDWGNGQLTVAGGATLDTRGNQSPCLQPFHYCDTFVGGAAGDTAMLTVTGSGTRARFGQNLFVAQPGLAIQHLDGFTYGQPGGTTRGTVQVSGGAVLSTDRAQIAPRHWSTNATGQERNIGEVLVSGTGSTWEVIGGLRVDNVTGTVFEGGASVLTANDRNAWATLAISDGGRLHIVGTQGVYNGINLTTGGGRTDARVSGAGSRIDYSGDAGYLQVGRSLGSASLDILAGAQVQGLYYGSVGRDGSFGSLTIDGVDSLLRLDGTASAAANGTLNAAVMEIGRNGTGTVVVRNGGRLELVATQATPAGMALYLGREASSSGTLSILGTGSAVLMQSTSVLPGGGAGETLNPQMRVGREGSGVLSIGAGGKLLLEGGAVSTPEHRRSTSLYVGGVGDSTPGGKGIATVSGSGSEIRLTGTDTFIGVGIGPSSTGQLTISQQGQVSAIGMSVGRSGGVGVLTVDAGVLSFSGQQTSGSLVGAFFTVGSGGAGIGVATMSNGSVMTLSNPGSAGAGFSLGGSLNFAGGDGSLTLSGGSRIDVVAAPGLAAANVGREGTGLLRLRDASALDLGDGNLYVGRFSGSDGTLIATGGSTIDAGWVGIGRHIDTATGVHADGGTGTMVLNGATLNATDIVIGTNGYLGGSAGSINASGTITNHGIFSPGSSPGVFTINGHYVAAAGSRLILEVQSDGQGGFLSDEVRFGALSTVDLGSLTVEFRFLGDTDPNAFRASGGFDIDTFVGQDDGTGTFSALADAAFAGVRFSASADAYVFENFSYSAAGGVAFTAVAVPEPGTWALWSAGLLALARLRRRRSV